MLVATDVLYGQVLQHDHVLYGLFLVFFTHFFYSGGLWRIFLKLCNFISIEKMEACWSRSETNGTGMSAQERS